MSRLCALGSASAIAFEVALLAAPDAAYGQRSETTLPPVSVEAPKAAVKRRARKPEERTAAVRRPTPKPVAVAEPPRPAVTPAIDGGGVNASYGTPPVV